MTPAIPLVVPFSLLSFMGKTREMELGTPPTPLPLKVGGDVLIFVPSAKRCSIWSKIDLSPAQDPRPL